MEFTKMQGLGNDYLFINCVDEAPADLDWPTLARCMSERHFGVGSDGIILVLPSKSHDFRMRIFNSDGSEAQMCGNGIRCFARYVYERGLTRKRSIEVETLAGVIAPEIIVGEKDGTIIGVRVDMGIPRLLPSEIPAYPSLLPRNPDRKPISLISEWEAPIPGETPIIEDDWLIEGHPVKATLVSMGNPHCVLFWPGVTEEDVMRLGPKIERHPAFPERINVEFVEVLDDSTIKVVVWERGSGFTLACGTGACAATVASVLGGRTSRRVKVALPGGDLSVEWPEGGRVFMTGPAEEVFRGRYTGKCGSIQ
ncbi:MAG TPA: diaminopimelate epimerase [Clostridia bacterium]|nr:diaminopimelate epimerase [Clostridia bacterium]